MRRFPLIVKRQIKGWIERGSADLQVYQYRPELSQPAKIFGARTALSACPGLQWTRGHGCPRSFGCGFAALYREFPNSQALRFRTFCRLGSRRLSRFGNLRYESLRVTGGKRRDRQPRDGVVDQFEEVRVEPVARDEKGFHETGKEICSVNARCRVSRSPVSTIRTRTGPSPGNFDRRTV